MKKSELARRFLTACEAAEYCRLSVGHMANLRSRKQGPAYFAVNSKILYALEDLNIWLESFRVKTGFTI